MQNYCVLQKRKQRRGDWLKRSSGSRKGKRKEGRKKRTRSRKLKLEQRRLQKIVLRRVLRGQDQKNCHRRRVGVNLLMDFQAMMSITVLFRW